MSISFNWPKLVNYMYLVSNFLSGARNSWTTLPIARMQDCAEKQCYVQCSRNNTQVFSCIMCIQRHAFQMLQRSVLNSCVRCSLTFAYFFWPFSFVTNKDLTSRSDKLVQQSGSTPKSVLSHQFPCLCLLTVPGHFVFPFSPLQIVDTFDRLLPPAEGLKQCWRRAVKNNTGCAKTGRWDLAVPSGRDGLSRPRVFQRWLWSLPSAEFGRENFEGW